jgi:hypothetical protein
LFLSPTYDDHEGQALAELYDDINDLSSLPLSKMQPKDLTEMLRILNILWTSSEINALQKDESVLLDISSKLSSAEKEQHFLSGGYFQHRVEEILRPEYTITHDDHTNARSWTHDYQDIDLSYHKLNFTMRDLGGDELNRHHWTTAMDESFCIVYIVSLTDYCKLEDTDPHHHLHDGANKGHLPPPSPATLCHLLPRYKSGHKGWQGRKEGLRVESKANALRS